MTAISLTLGALNYEATAPHELAHFWSQVTGAAVDINGVTAYLAPQGPHGFGMFFQPAEAPTTGRQTLHPDLTVPWGSRQAEVERLVALGATVQWDVLEEFEHVQWTTLADPEGNLFCIAEHPPAA